MRFRLNAALINASKKASVPLGLDDRPGMVDPKGDGPTDRRADV
jgi:hypothetical protein